MCSQSALHRGPDWVVYLDATAVSRRDRVGDDDRSGHRAVPDFRADAVVGQARTGRAADDTPALVRFGRTRDLRYRHDRLQRR